MNEEQRSAINAILFDFVTQANVYPLMDELQHKKDQYGDSILTEYHAMIIRAERNEHDMKRKFIEILRTRQGFHQFVEALIKTEQTTLVHKLNEHLPVAKRIDVQAVRDRLRLEKEKLFPQPTSPPSADSNSGRNPVMTHAMDKSSKSKLTKNGDSICSTITNDALEQINMKMNARGHLTAVNIQHIESKPMPYSKNSTLLDVLRTRTQQAYVDFLDILRDEEIGLAWLADRIEGITTHPEDIPKQDLDRKVTADDQSNKKGASTRLKKSSSSNDSPEDAKDHLPESIITEALLPAERPKYILKYGIFGALLICALTYYYFPLNVNSLGTKTKKADEKTEYYLLDTKPKGHMLIIANENFDTLKPNTGALVDQKTVERLGEILGYDVKSSHRDLTAEQMRQELKKFVEKIKTEPYVASAIVFVLSHGGPHEIYGVDGNTIKRQEIFDALKADKCGALKGKPKLIFFDACRGDKHDPGAVNKGKSAEHQKRSDSHKDRTYTPDERSAALAEHEIVKAIAYTEEQEKELETKGPRLSIMSDMLIVDATAMDYYAYGTSKGSHFINAISQIFESNFETKSIDEMLHMVHDHVLEIMQEGRKEDEYHSVEGTNYQSSFRKKFMFCPPSAN